MKSLYPAYHFIPTGPITRCQVCNHTPLRPILDLGFQPLPDTLLTDAMLSMPEQTYPLRAVWCPHCTVVQLDYCVDGKEVYHPDYPYRPGITQDLVAYQEGMSRDLTAKYGLTKNDLVIDIGSNDGTLLAGFKKQGVRVLGIEPTNIAKIAQKEGIPTIQDFFTVKLARAVKKRYGPAALIITTNTFAHMQTLGEFIVGAHTLLTDNGVFINETHYLLDIIKNGQFDSIYHEHLRTYSLASLIALFKPYDFTLTDVERGNRYGGNIRMHATKGKRRHVNASVASLLALEKKEGLDNYKTFEQFASRVKRARLAFMEFLIRAKKNGTRVVGDACPARSVTLLNYFGADRELIPYITEQPTSLKLNHYLPGKHIPIVNNERLIREQPDFVVILAWHLAEPIMKRLKARGLRADFIVPLPDFRIIKNKDVRP